MYKLTWIIVFVQSPWYLNVICVCPFSMICYPYAFVWVIWFQYPWVVICNAFYVLCPMPCLCHALYALCFLPCFCHTLYVLCPILCAMHCICYVTCLACAMLYALFVQCLVCAMPNMCHAQFVISLYVIIRHKFCFQI